MRVGLRSALRRARGGEALSPGMNCANVPVEVHETKDIELLCDDATLSLLGERHKFRPYLLFGGHPALRRARS